MQLPKSELVIRHYQVPIRVIADRAPLKSMSWTDSLPLTRLYVQAKTQYDPDDHGKRYRSW